MRLLMTSIASLVVMVAFCVIVTRTVGGYGSEPQPPATELAARRADPAQDQHALALQLELFAKVARGVRPAQAPTAAAAIRAHYPLITVADGEPGAGELAIRARHEGLELCLGSPRLWSCRSAAAGSASASAETLEDARAALARR